KSLRDARAESEAVDLEQRFAALAAESAEPLWAAHLDEYEAALSSLASSGFDEADRLLAPEGYADALTEFLAAESSAVSNRISGFRELRARVSLEMLASSVDDVRGWIDAMPASLGALQALEQFESDVRRLGARLEAVPAVTTAVEAKKAA